MEKVSYSIPYFCLEYKCVRWTFVWKAFCKGTDSIELWQLSNHCARSGFLARRPRIEPTPAALEGSLNHGTTRAIPHFSLTKKAIWCFLVSEFISGRSRTTLYRKDSFIWAFKWSVKIWLSNPTFHLYKVVEFT